MTLRPLLSRYGVRRTLGLIVVLLAIAQTISLLPMTLVDRHFMNL
jgi:hypothetical protein